MIDADIDAKFEIAGAFRQAFQKRFSAGRSAHSKEALLWLYWIVSPRAKLIVSTDSEQIHLLQSTDPKNGRAK